MHFLIFLFSYRKNEATILSLHILFTLSFFPFLFICFDRKSHNCIIPRRKKWDNWKDFLFFSEEGFLTRPFFFILKLRNITRKVRIIFKMLTDLYNPSRLGRRHPWALHWERISSFFSSSHCYAYYVFQTLYLH